MGRERAARLERSGAKGTAPNGGKLPRVCLSRFTRALARYRASLTLVALEGEDQELVLDPAILQLAGPSFAYLGGGASVLRNGRPGEVAFFLCYFGNQQAALDCFKQLARESGATVLALGLLDDVNQHAEAPDAIWAMSVYHTLRNTLWCRAEGNYLLFGSFAASVEAWKRLHQQLQVRAKIDEPAAAESPPDPAKLSKAVGRAYQAYRYVEEKTERPGLEDRAAYKWLKSNGTPNELDDYKLPEFQTWARYLREARRALRQQKYSSRSGRPHGQSVVGQDDVEPHVRNPK